MKLFLIKQDQNTNYDTYDSAVVAAENEEKARNIHPGSEEEWQENQARYPRYPRYPRWCTSPDFVTVAYIGEAKEGTEAGVIIASFNAG